MTFEQETKQISDFLRMNCGCFSPSGILTAAAERLDAQAERIAELERLNLSFATNEQELGQYRNEKNWTRPFDINGRLMNEHALYLPKVMK